MRQIVDETNKGKGRYVNEKSCAEVQAKRIENYSEELYQILDEYGTEISPVIGEFNRTSSEKTMGVLWARSTSKKIQSGKIHQEMVEGIAVECAKKLGLNVGLTRLIANNHDIGQMFYGFRGEGWISEIKEKYGLGVYTHNSIGPKELIYRHRIYAKIIEEIKFFNPNISESELKRIGRSLWVIFDGINSHRGVFSEMEARPNPEKTNGEFLDELLSCHTEKGFDRSIRPATIEGCLIRICNRIVYTSFDLLDGLTEGIIDKIDGEYIEILEALGITRSEIDEANTRKQYQRIARKLQVTFAKSLIEHSSRDIITMDPIVGKSMKQLGNLNNTRIINLSALLDEERIIPNSIDILINHFGDVIERELGDVEELREASIDKSIAGYLMDRYSGTEDEGFCQYIAGTTPEIYEFNEIMLETVEMNEEIAGNKQSLSFKRRMALEFGAEYLSTLNDTEFLDLLVVQKIIDKERRNLLVRNYKSLGRERLIRERYISEEKRKLSQESEKNTEEISR
ncbi:MAG: hypothetical protein HFJ50_09225 [Clostridia bacterium]|nr:hypothetical protein [Clostridia bacterium]